MAVTTLACDYSVRHGEQLFATAPRAETWILLEYPLPWAAKAYEESAIPTAVKAHIDSQVALMPHARVQLIAKSVRQELIDLALYVIYAGAETQRMRRFTLPTYETLLGVPLAEIAGGVVDAGTPLNDPVYIVCTNGKRDVCCAKHGLPLYKALSQMGGEHVWQCNHIGGHRFAGTCVVFPQGIYYGRLTAQDAPVLMQAASHSDLLPFIRGRACLEPAVQAAEYFLHNHIQERPAQACYPISSTWEDGQWRVILAASDCRYEVTMAVEATPFDVVTNSGAVQGEPGIQFRLIDIMQQ
jgi:hypothetical protein